MFKCNGSSLMIKAAVNINNDVRRNMKIILTIEYWNFYGKVKYAWSIYFMSE